VEPKSAKAMNKKAIIKQVRAVLEKDRRINLHRYPIAIAAQNGDLILTGEVESIAAKKLALVAASETHGVGRIVDRLKVTPAEKMGDAEIRDHVCKVLFGEPALERCLIHCLVGNDVATVRKATGGPAGSIVVAVSDGTVTLNGEVPSLSHKRLAGVLAWWVPGTRDVVNGLEEVPAEEDNDDELTDAVHLALEKDPFVDATKIRVTTKEWVVTMDGLVPNETMKQMAERDAWYVLGVSEVINRIQAER
ncbi:MAG TPA: BON domain-containing protein, partial [Candidatus Binatia bacterium]|nr:BON domain-containing protein [Candidatus Binatia bacterium]